MDDEVKPEHTRRTITFTHRQAGGITLAGVALALAPYLKETFITRSEGEKVAMELTYMRKEITEMKESVDKFPDKVDTSIKSVMKQVQRDLDRNEKRVENLEIYAYKSRRNASY